MLKVICVVLLSTSVLVKAQELTDDYNWSDEDYSEDYSEEFESPEFGAKHGHVINAICRKTCGASHSRNTRTARHDRLCLYLCNGPAVTTTTQAPTTQAPIIVAEPETVASSNHQLSHQDHFIISSICKAYCKPATNHALRTYGFCTHLCHKGEAIGKPAQQTEPPTTLPPTTPKPLPVEQVISNHYHLTKFCQKRCSGKTYHRHPACGLLCRSRPSSPSTTPAPSNPATTPPESPGAGFPTLPPSVLGSSGLGSSGSGSTGFESSGSGSSGLGSSGPGSSGPGSSGPGLSGPGSSGSKPSNVEKPEDLLEAARLLKSYCNRFCPAPKNFRMARSSTHERMCESVCSVPITESPIGVTASATSNPTSGLFESTTLG